jgi:putative intracellular protease/amidase
MRWRRRAAGGGLFNSPNIVEDRNLATGQNPQSDHPFAARLVAALDRAAARGR